MTACRKASAPAGLRLHKVKRPNTVNAADLDAYEINLEKEAAVQAEAKAAHQVVPRDDDLVEEHEDDSDAEVHESLTTARSTSARQTPITSPSTQSSTPAQRFLQSPSKETPLNQVETITKDDSSPAVVRPSHAPANPLSPSPSHASPALVSSSPLPVLGIHGPLQTFIPHLDPQAHSSTSAVSPASIPAPPIKHGEARGDTGRQGENGETQESTGITNRSDTSKKKSDRSV